MSDMKKNPEKKLTPTKAFHIYAGDKCICPNVSEDEFEEKWTTIKNIVGLMKTDYSIEDLTYEEVTVQKQEEASY